MMMLALVPATRLLGMICVCDCDLVSSTRGMTGQQGKRGIRLYSSRLAIVGTHERERSG